MSFKSYKTAIIGGGTIGLYLGLKLKERGHNITLFEKRDKIGTDVCSGIFSEKIFKFIPESENLVENEIKCALLHFPKKTISLFFKKKFFLISHSKLDDLLYSKIKENVELGKEVSSLPKNFEKTIGADGANSFARNYLKLKKPEFRIGIRGFLNERNFSNTVETWPLKNGFIWKIPRGEKTEYGIMENPIIAKKRLDIFLKKNKIRLNNIEARVIPCGFSLSKNRSITLCGDSTGITKPWSGGGVIWGLKSADILINSFPNFETYYKKTKKYFKKKIFFYKLLTKAVYLSGTNIPFIIPKKNTIEPDFLI